ncbi:MAG: hypothetical protein QOD56_629 [Gammaproteobacteria bacterium]|nr:hypothetical protein [Gammaproteobacteria bacterium]
MSAPILTAGVQRVVDRRSLIVMLGGLSLLGPLSIDAYLPAFADIQRELHASTSRLPSFSFRPGLAPIRTDSLPDRGTWG